MKPVEIARVKGFAEGETNCIRCGKTLRLWWNGGELDREHCCGLTYVTEHQEVDLVIYGANAPDMPMDEAGMPMLVAVAGGRP